MLSLNSLHSCGLPHTTDPSTSASLELGLKTYNVMLALDGALDQNQGLCVLVNTLAAKLHG